MFYYLSEYHQQFGPLRLFSFVTFRAAGAAFTAMVLVILFGPLTYKLLKRFRLEAKGRYDDIFDKDLIDENKENTPSMGGVLIILAITISALLWGDLSNSLLKVFLSVLLALGGVGFLDDYQKVRRPDSKGVSAKFKLFYQIIIAGIAVSFIFQIPSTSDYMFQFMVPFLKEPLITGFSGGVIVAVISILAIVGSSNAVNLTDGRDGLAVGCSIFAALTYAAFAYLCGHRVFAEYLKIPYILGAGEIGVFAAALAGACIGFLWYNCYPAMMFMGDTGSLALGGTIAMVAVLVRQELTLVIVGGVFVIEALSVILQVSYFKLTRKRIFLCAPIHHHFERKGWTETQVVVRFWIIAGICALAGLATLKIR